MAKNDTAIVALGEWLEDKYGVSCGENSHFGGVTPGAHTPTSYHYKDEALDVNRASDEAKVLNEIYDLLAPQAGALGIKELFFQNRGIPTPVSDHYDHLHVALVGPPTPALAKLLASKALGDTPINHAVGAVTGAAGDAASFAGDQALNLAKGIVGTIFDAIGEDGARILMYLVLVVGGAALVYYGTARAAGMRAPIGTPAKLALAGAVKAPK